MRIHAILFVGSLCLAACGGDDDDAGDGGNQEEVITTVTLTFAPEGGGEDVVAVWDDPDGDGGSGPTIDPVALAAGTYDLTLTFENGLEDPPEDITVEIEDESDQHQIFLTGTAVDGPASDQADAPLAHTYNDEDANGLPIGLDNTIVAEPGEGTLTVTLRHLPPVNDSAVKTAELAQQVIDDGIGALPGATDASVNFEVTVE